MVDRSRPSEQRDPLVNGGLKSSTKNCDRSRVRDGASGMHEDRFTRMEGGGTSVGRVTSAVGGSLEDGGTCMEGVGGVGFACTGSGGVLESRDFFCNSDNDNGRGAVISSVDAAQSQWGER